MNYADMVFVLFSSALVMFMVPGLAFFYGGLVRSKNVLSTMFFSIFSLGIIALIWFLYGYSFAFGKDIKGLIGGFDYLFLNNLLSNKENAMSDILFCSFQMFFACITPALISGAFVERIKLSAFVVFMILWTTFVYIPVCHWVWGEGWIFKMGALDFAGGAVIHINSASAALVAAFMVGKRKGWKQKQLMPHNIPFTILGAAMLWFGWFGFNAGSALKMNNIACIAFLNTHLAASAALVSWLVAERIKTGKATVLGAASGAISGLVAITPAAGFVSFSSSVIIGLIAGALCFYALSLKSKFSFDDSLDVVAIHGIGGVLGALCTGVFASKAINPDGADGLIFGNFKLFLVQSISVIAVIAFSMLMSYIIFKIINSTIGIRVNQDEELTGLDLAMHNEEAYEKF